MPNIEHIMYKISTYLEEFIKTPWGKLLLGLTIAFIIIKILFGDMYIKLTVKPDGDCTGVPISFYHNEEGDTLKYCHQREDGTIGLRYGEPYTDTWETFDIEQWTEAQDRADAFDTAHH